MKICAKSIFVVSILLAGCGGNPGGEFLPSTPNPFNMPDMDKRDCLSYGEPSVGPVESTPVLWNGVVLLVTGPMPYQTSFRIDTFDCKTLIGAFEFPAYYVNAFVNNGTMYVYGQTGNNISMISSTDLQTWTAPAIVVIAPVGMKFYNTSITQDATGYVMAIESFESGLFISRFARSNDLIAWVMLPDTFIETEGVAPAVNCPWLWFNASDGYYYILYLTLLEGQQVTAIARASDLVTWEKSARANNLVPFTAAAGEGNNTSDVALLEHNGIVYAAYARGYQTSWLNLATATYVGTLAQYVALFF